MKENVVIPTVSNTEKGFDHPDAIMEKRIRDLEMKLNSVNQYIYQQDFTEEAWNNSGGFSLDRLHRMVYGIVGLKEVVVTENRLGKLLWALLLVLGVGATIFFVYATTSEYLSEPTATKVKFNLSVDYSFPAVALCPYAWMDAEKAAHLGLSMEGFKYSLLYADTFFPGLRFTNFTQARDDFFSFYHSNNFQSLLDYYKNISLDFVIVNSSKAFENNSNAIKLPDSNVRVEKLFIGSEICYAYAATVQGRSLYTRTNANMKFMDKTLDTVNMPAGVWLQLVTDWNFLNTPAPRLFMPSGSRSKILVESRHVVTVPSSDHPCKDADSTPKTYSAFQCSSQCQNKNYKETLNCEIFRFSTVSNAQSPEHYCHNMEKLPNRTMDLAQFRVTAQNSNITKRCFKSCPERCDRVTYKPFVQWTVMLDDGKRITGNNIGKQVSAEIFIEHIANYEGGSVSLTEISTFSFIDLMGNIGGMLGIFVGATAMTVVQLVGYFVQAVYRKLRFRRISVRKISSPIN